LKLLAPRGQKQQYATVLRQPEAVHAGNKIIVLSDRTTEKIGTEYSLLVPPFCVGSGCCTPPLDPRMTCG